MKVNVYIVQGKGDIHKVKKLFSKFDNVVVIDYDDVITTLRKDENDDKEVCTLIVKQSTISLADEDKIYSVIRGACSRYDKNKYDVYYLTTWGDACQKRRIYSEKYNLYHTYEPRGNQALMFTPRGRKRILADEAMENGSYFKSDDIIHHEVEKGNITAITSFPNLVSFDPNAAVDNNEYTYLNECRPVRNVADSATTTAYIWFIVAFILILIVGYAFFAGKGRYY